ncbi:hypothetical protein [Streptomyces sp. PSKA30]|uniref:hypothetical protein n=1 Tax=Streptomyces sp. PSKA30 TaxID=2874597 RepID=UPI001CD0A5C9|nr:hypothetical protein [Streptomyces sp. PSKA30]MBZ9643972.1 hypothetical protein [Streptomyces sp. PSKA30]
MFGDAGLLQGRGGQLGVEAGEDRGLDALGHGEAHPTDRRATLVSLTDRGREVTAGLRGGRDDLAAALFADMPPGQLDDFTLSLAQVIERLKAVDPTRQR